MFSTCVLTHARSVFTSLCAELCVWLGVFVVLYGYWISWVEGSVGGCPQLGSHSLNEVFVECWRSVGLSFVVTSF